MLAFSSKSNGNNHLGVRKPQHLHSLVRARAIILSAQRVKKAYILREGVRESHLFPNFSKMKYLLIIAFFVALPLATYQNWTTKSVAKSCGRNFVRTDAQSP